MVKRMILTLVGVVLLSTPAFADRGKTKMPRGERAYAAPKTEEI